MKLNNAAVLIVSVSLLNPQFALAQFNGTSNSTTTVSDKFLQATSATTTTTTTTSTSTSTLPTIASIQQEAMMVKQSNQKGIQMAQMLTGIAAVGVAVTCPKSSKCKWWVAGLAASYLMARNMKKAAQQSDYAGAEVTVENPDRYIQDAQVVNPEGESPTTTDATSDGIHNNVSLKTKNIESPDMRKAKAAIDNLKKQGWKINEKTGDVTSPKGEKVTAAMMKSPQAMARAGAPASFMKDFSNAHKEAAKKVAEQKAKTADAGEGAFGDSVGGGGGGRSSFAGSSDGMAGYGGVPGGSPAAGADRGPSQVAGMATNYNGEKIGVAGDSLFHMIDRRYELHQKKGSFLEP